MHVLFFYSVAVVNASAISCLRRFVFDTAYNALLHSIMCMPVAGTL